MSDATLNCLIGKLDAIISALGGSPTGNIEKFANTSVRGTGAVTIPIGATEFGYAAIGGTITVGGVTIPAGASASESTPAGRTASVVIADDGGSAFWYYSYEA